MQTIATLSSDAVNPPESELETGQFYKFTDDELSIWQIVSVDYKFTLICVIPDSKHKSDQGKSFTGSLHEDISDVFGTSAEHFQFISNFTGAIN